MKNIRIYSLVLCSFFALLSCDDGGIMDEAPDETLKGTLTDSYTGKNYNAESQQGWGFQFFLKEISYADNAPERKYNGMHDGTYQHTKLFDAEYSLEIRGAFLPVPIENVKVSGTVVKDFTVTPFTNFSEVSASKSGTDITVKFKVNRTTTAGGDMKQIRVYVTRYALADGHNSFELRGIINPNSAESDAMYGGVEQSITLSGADPSIQYYAVVATRTANTSYYNLSDAVEVN